MAGRRASESAPQDILGGAQVEEVEEVRMAPPESPANTLEIVTTALGTFGPLGIVPVGWRGYINPAAFSSNWMRPATKKAEDHLRRFREGLPEPDEEQGDGE